MERVTVPGAPKQERPAYNPALAPCCTICGTRYVVNAAGFLEHDGGGCPGKPPEQVRTPADIPITPNRIWSDDYDAY